MTASRNHRQMMIIWRIIIFAAVFVNYATCRTAKDYREAPGVAAAVRQSQVQQFPSYNLAAPDGPGTYAFGYEIEDSVTGNIQFRDEEKLRNGTIKGSYGVLSPDDTVRLTRYTADHLGYRTTQEETRRRSDNNGPMKLEVQVQPSVKPPQSLTGEHIGTVSKTSSSSSTFDPYQTRNSQFDPNSQAALATAIFHQQQHINSLPTFGPTEFHGPPNIFDQQFDQQMNYPYGLPPGLPPSEFSPFEGGYLRQMQTQPGPIFGFFANLAQHNPVTNFLNQFNPSQQQQPTTTQNTPILNLLSNLNPLNLLNNNNNNRPTVTIPTVTVSTPSLGIQSDYVMTSPSPSGQLVAYPSVPTSSLSGNIDNSVFSYNEQFFNPNSASAQFNYPYGGGGVNYGTFGNFQPSSSIYSPQQYPSNSYLNQFTQTTNRPFQTYPNGNFIQPNSYLYGNSHRQNPTSTFYQNPYQTNLGSPIIAVNPLNYYGNRRKPGMSKNGSATKKKNNKTKVEIDESGSAWFQDFLNQRKQTSLGDVTTVKQPQRPTKAKPATSDEDNDSSGLEDYFR